MKPFLDCRFALLICYTMAVTLSLAACSKAPEPIAVKAINTEGLDLITIAPANSTAQRAWLGVVEATQQALLSAQTSGRLAELLVDVGDAVKENQVLARLSEVEQLAGKNRAQAMVSSATASAIEAESDFKRSSNLLRDRVISAQELEQSLARRDSARAQLASARAQLREATQQLNYTIIRAPFDGVVSARHVQVGEAIASGSALLSMNAPGLLRLRLSLPQADALALDTAQTAQIVLNDGTQLAATRMLVFPTSDAQTHTVTVRLDVPSTIGLQPGMTLRAIMASRAQVEKATSLVATAQPEIQIPFTAVVQRGEVSGVYVVSKQAITLRQIRLGHRAGEQVEVLSGLNPSERIAADPLAASLRLAERK